MNVAHVRAVIRYGSAELLAAVVQDASRKTGHSAKELSAAFQLIDGVAPVVVVSHRAGVDLAALDPATSFKMIGAAPGYSSALLLWPASADPENGEARYFLYKCGPDSDSQMSKHSKFNEISWNDAMRAYYSMWQQEELPQDLFPSIDAAVAFLRRHGG